MWISAPDGSKARQLTTLGTASQPLQRPDHVGRRQGDRGGAGSPRRQRLPAGFDADELDRSGHQLRSPFHPTQYTTQLGGSCTIKVVQAPQGILAAVSPDGKHIALNPLADNYTFDCGGLFISYVYVVDLTGKVTNGQIKPPGNDSPLSYDEPAWVNNTRLLLYEDINNADDTYVLGNATASHWIAPSDFTDNAYQYPSLRSGRFATTAGTTPVNRSCDCGPAPGRPQHPRRVATSRTRTRRSTTTSPSSSWCPGVAPDGGAVVWEEIDKTGATPKTAVYVSPVGDISNGLRLHPSPAARLRRQRSLLEPGVAVGEVAR